MARFPVHRPARSLAGTYWIYHSVHTIGGRAARGSTLFLIVGDGRDPGVLRAAFGYVAAALGSDARACCAGWSLLPARLDARSSGFAAGC